EGSHAGGLESARAGLEDGRFSGFRERLRDLLVENMRLQASAGADAVAIFDTCAGELEAEAYAKHAVPALREGLERFGGRCPVIYYSRGTGPAHWQALRGLPIACLGIDWNHDLPRALSEWSKDFAIQGNIDPSWLHLPASELEPRLLHVFTQVKK